MDKAQIRKTMLARRWALTSKYVNDHSDRVFDLLAGLHEIKNAKNVMIYSHFANEVKTGKLAGWLLFHEKRVFLPVVDGDKLLIADMSSTCFEMNSYGIAQPEKETACFAKTEEIDVFIVPGLAFDAKGNRIGFGKGYYDDFQITDTIIPERHDVKMDMVVTPKKVFRRPGA